MTELVYSGQELPKKAFYLSLCLVIPLISYLGYYEIAVYSLFTYIALVFYQADHFNIRFIIAMVAIEEMLAQIIQDLILLFTRIIFKIEDYSFEVFLVYLTQGILALVMCFAILNRGQIVDWFNGTTKSYKRYRLIGMEWLIILTYFFIVLLHIIFLSFTFDSIMQISTFDTYAAWFEQQKTAVYIKNYGNVYLITNVFLLFSIQSYNYKRCRREWRLNS